ncbi:HK97 gp10 family phage protein [Acetanaerobacterium elongatum]|uniref:Bacteriophage HK97-gp10, putative tail-component n=1 Tax=Acetanaerobacterium elongatum TaxID=258515 RepID=A0A1G9Z1D6_9FIRM|nr:HK97 gp10 family phage protein [Acetanaerobacterium elongatum]SDN15159.1 Bacteriophage HK97-gp10, putative tail-component [Acetanaerobacterium elongatum]
MAGDFSTQDFAHFKQVLKNLKADLDVASCNVLNNAVNIARRVTVENTPVGDYSREVSFTTKDGREVHFSVTGRMGGTLKRSWDVKRARLQGRTYEAELYNTADYAPYVNDGHRVVDRDRVTIGYVKGQFMLEKGLNAARGEMQNLFNAEIRRVKQRSGF